MSLNNSSEALSGYNKRYCFSSSLAHVHVVTAQVCGQSLIGLYGIVFAYIVTYLCLGRVVY